MADIDVISNPNTATVDRKLAATDMILALVTETISQMKALLLMTARLCCQKRND
jgi:hypothetical protein